MAKKNKNSKKKKDKLLKLNGKIKSDKKKDKQKKKKNSKAVESEQVTQIKQPISTPVASDLTETTLHLLKQLSDSIYSVNNAPIVYNSETIFPAELTALKQISLDQPTNVATLAGHLGISKSAALKTANKLNFKGLIHKEVSPETKTILLSVNSNGEAVLKKIPTFNEKNKERILETIQKIPTDSLKEFNNILTLIVEDEEKTGV